MAKNFVHQHFRHYRARLPTGNPRFSLSNIHGDDRRATKESPKSKRR